MEFWGIEVKAGQTVKCDPGNDKYLHLSQASIGEFKKASSTTFPVSVKVDDKKLVIGTLSTEKCPQITYDLVFEKEFELSHGWKDGSVFFVGYKTVSTDGEPDDFSDTDSEGMMIPEAVEKANGKPAAKEEPKATAKPNVQKPSAAVSKVKPEENVSESDDDSDSEDDDEDEAGDKDESNEDESDSEEDEDTTDSSEDEKVTPQKPVNGKKRPLESDSKSSAADKKAKVATPVKTDAKKGGVHVATPHPAKSKQQTPKSGGTVVCKSCSKTFNSEPALQSHTKAKHAAAK